MVTYVSGYQLLFAGPGLVSLSDDDAAYFSAFYCPAPDCNCRSVLLVGRRPNESAQCAAIFHAFDPTSRHPEHGATWLSEMHVQGNDAARWIAPVREALLATRQQVVRYEADYLRIRAAGIDPTDPIHVAVRTAAGLAPLPPPARPAPRSAKRTLRGRAMEPAHLAATRADAEALLALPGIQDKVSGADLLVLAMALDRPRLLTAAEAVAALRARGVSVGNERKLTERMVQSARDTGRFARPADDAFLPLPDALLVAHVAALTHAPALAPLLRARASVPAPTPAPAVPRASARARTSVASPPGATPRPTPAPSVSGAIPAAGGPAPPAATPAPAPPAVAPPVFSSAPRTLPVIATETVTRVLADAPAAPSDVKLCLDAWRLSFAAQFDELLALASLRDVTPHRYQTETVRRVLRVLRGRGILADEVGLGKTVEAIMVLREYQVRGMARRALILVPAPLVAQWTGELASKAGVQARTPDDAMFRDAPEQFWSAPGVVVASLALARGARHAEFVQATPWDLVIVDEAHHIKNRATQGWKLVSALKRRFLLLVTATPVENDLEEIYNLVTLLRPGQFDTPAAFRKRFVDPKDPTRPRDREALRALLAEVMVRNTRAQSGLALPPRFVNTVTVEPTPAERALYEHVVAFLRAHHEDPGLRLAASALLLEAGSSPRAVRATVDGMLARRLGRGEAAVRRDLQALVASAGAVGPTRKCEALLEVLAAQRDPVLVFTRYRETLEEVVAAVARAGVAAVPFHGGLDERGRAQALARFRAGGAVVMVATAAGSEGHNLQHCNVLVNFDLPWNPMAIEQRIGRLHRMGQAREVHVYNLCARGTIEERVLDVLDRRVQLFQLVVGEMDMVLGNLAEDRDLEDWLVASVARAKSDADVDAAFDQLAAELLAARGRYEQTRALDAALFGKDFEA